MAKIIINNKFCKITEEKDINFIRQLDRNLSFKVQGAEHTYLYKMKRWDGFQRVLNRDLTFSYGLLSRIKSFYKKANKLLEIEDKRPEKTPINSIDVFPALKLIKKMPYPYQLEALEAVKKNDIGIIRAATGAGKTIIALLMTAYFGKSTCLYVIGKDLLYQLHNFFSKVFDEEIGIIGDGKCEIRRINVVSVWSVGQVVGVKKNKVINDFSDDEKNIDVEKYNEIKSMLLDSKVHIFDECHLAACDTIQNISRYIDPEHIYGMSASPWRDDGADLLIESIFGHKIVEVPASYLIENGYLAKPLIRFKTVPKVRGLPDSYPGVYKHYITDNDVRNDLVIEAAVKMVEKGYQTLILYQRVSHGKLLFKKLKEKMPCMLLSGKDSNSRREEVKQKLEDGEINAIVASTIFDIGVDLPSLSGLVIAGGGKSSVRALQRIGRVIRRFKHKKYAAVIDFWDQAKFLKSHSEERYKIYSSEPGFLVTKPK